MAVLLIGTLDTKGVEIQFVRDLLHAAGIATVVVDAGVLQPPAFAPEVSREQVFTNVARAMAGMVQQPSRPAPAAEERPLLAATMFGVTTPCVEAARKLVEEKGFEVLVFHATGTGGMTLEAFLGDGLISGVLDL